MNAGNPLHSSQSAEKWIKEKVHAAGPNGSGLLFLMAFPFTLWAQQANYKVLPDGVMVFPHTEFSGGTKAVQLKVMAPGIIQVIASPFTKIEARNSLVVIAKPQTSGFSVKEENGRVVLITGVVSVIIHAQSGAVSFVDNAGRVILAERGASGRVHDLPMVG